MTRREFPKQVRAEAAARANGRCEQCTAKILSGGFHYDHIVADGLGGEPILSNCMVLCKACHGVKTATHDTPAVAKMKRQRERNIGIGRRKSRPMAGTTASGLRKRMNGIVERRP